MPHSARQRNDTLHKSSRRALGAKRCIGVVYTGLLGMRKACGYTHHGTWHRRLRLPAVQGPLARLGCTKRWRYARWTEVVGGSSSGHMAQVVDSGSARSWCPCGCVGAWVRVSVCVSSCVFDDCSHFLSNCATPLRCLQPWQLAARHTTRQALPADQGSRTTRSPMALCYRIVSPCWGRSNSLQFLRREKMQV